MSIPAILVRRTAEDLKNTPTLRFRGSVMSLTHPLPTRPRSLDNLAGVTGRIVTPDDPTYDDARRVFYGGIDKRPSAIVRVKGIDDIRRVIACARDEGYDLAVRSGGHSVVG